MKGNMLVAALLIAFANLLSGHAVRSKAETEDYYVQQLPSERFHDCHSKRVEVSYSAATVPAVNIHDGMGGFHETSTYLPCSDCLILSMHADLRYPDGTTADAKSGMWLHHAVFTNVNRKDVTCAEHPYQRFFATGNERTPIDLTANGAQRAGYYVSPNDQIDVSVELMNMLDSPQTVVFSVTYEFIPARMAKEFRSIVPMWLDVGGSCGDSDVPALPESKFNFTSPVWTSTTSGLIVFAAGHLHDAGTSLSIMRDGETVCESKPTYATGGHAGDASEHISHMSSCTDLEIKVGDQWTIQAFYDTDEHAPMARTDGSLEPVMGIALLYATGDMQWNNHSSSHRALKIFVIVLVGILIGGCTFWLVRKVDRKALMDRFRKTTAPREERANAALPLLNDLDESYRD